MELIDGYAYELVLSSGKMAIGVFDKPNQVFIDEISGDKYLPEECLTIVEL